MLVIITNILEFNIPNHFITMYLGFIPDNLNCSDKYLLKMMLAARIKSITMWWLQKSPPTGFLFINIMKQVDIIVHDKRALQCNNSVRSIKSLPIPFIWGILFFPNMKIIYNAQRHHVQHVFQSKCFLRLQQTHIRHPTSITVPWAQQYNFLI